MFREFLQENKENTKEKISDRFNKAIDLSLYSVWLITYVPSESRQLNGSDGMEILEEIEEELGKFKHTMFLYLTMYNADESNKISGAMVLKGGVFCEQVKKSECFSS